MITEFIDQDQLVFITIHDFQIKGHPDNHLLLVSDKWAAIMAKVIPDMWTALSTNEIMLIWINSEITIQPFGLKLKTLISNLYCYRKLQNISIMQT